MQHLPRHTLLTLFILVLMLSLIGTASAQAIIPNEPFAGQLASDDNRRLQFTASEGEVLSFVARNTQGNFDPILAIYDQDNALIIENDDVNYPAERDAVIEAFTAPYTGRYELEIRGFGNTSGQYSLTMLRGYGKLGLRDRFDSDSGWLLADIPNDNESDIYAQNGQLTLSHEGIDEAVVAFGLQPNDTTYYATTDIVDVQGAQGWRAGMVFKYQNEANYYHLLMNNRGAWRLSLVEDGQERVLRDWTVHPAIVAGENSFSLGVLVNEDNYSIFYNHQYVGTAFDATLEFGAVGVSIRTANAIGSAVTANFDTLLVTEPYDTTSAKNLVANGMNYTVRELERRGVIPAGGEMVMNIPESFAQNVTAGVSRFPIGSNITTTNFVLSADVSWTATGGQQGCGLIIRDNPNRDDSYWLAYVDGNGGYGSGYRNGSSFINDYYNTRVDIGDAPYTMLIAAVDDTVYYYLNNTLIHVDSLPVVAGTIGQAVVNFEAINTNCRYDDLWLWRLPD